MGNRAIQDSMSNVIKIVRGEAECYFNCFTSAIDPSGYPCYHSLIVGQHCIIHSISPYFRISFRWNFVFNLRLLLICWKAFCLIQVELLW